MPTFTNDAFKGIKKINLGKIDTIQYYIHSKLNKRNFDHFF